MNPFGFRYRGAWRSEAAWPSTDDFSARRVPSPRIAPALTAPLAEIVMVALPKPWGYAASPACAGSGGSNTVYEPACGHGLLLVKTFCTRLSFKSYVVVS